MDLTLPNPALALARKCLLEVNRILVRKPSPKTRPKWQKLQARLLEKLEGLEVLLGSVLLDSR